jgi:hypothetical protein
MNVTFDNIGNLKKFLCEVRGDTDTNNIRIEEYLVRDMLLNHESIIIGGCVRYFHFDSLGAGVYRVFLAEKGAKETVILKKKTSARG